jgi:hypothetical protein
VLQAIWKHSLVWAEKACANTVHFCLLPNKLSTSAAEQLHEFDLMDDVI